MIAILVCDRDERERETIGTDCRRRIAVGCDEALELTGASDDAELLLVAEDERLVHLLYYDYQAGQQMEGLRLFRRRCSGAMVMLITDASVSPLEYLRPGTAPDALLLRPLNEEMLDAVNGEFMDSFMAGKPTTALWWTPGRKRCFFPIPRSTTLRPGIKSCLSAQKMKSTPSMIP